MQSALVVQYKDFFSQLTPCYTINRTRPDIGQCSILEQFSKLLGLYKSNMTCLDLVAGTIKTHFSAIITLRLVSETHSETFHLKLNLTVGC